MATLKELHTLGQSVWLDFISRELLDSGQLAGLVSSGLRGLTSNPAIFEKAMGQGGRYAADIAAMTAAGLPDKEIYERLAVQDIQRAADVLRTVYDDSNGADGFVSLEVSPTLAHDTAGTLAEARRLWSAVARPNLMVKVPGTPEGVPAIRRLIAEGINVNVTLLFSQAAYAAVAEAHIEGLAERAAGGKAVDRVAGVASFFVSRIDSAVDALIEAAMTRSSGAQSSQQREALAALRGKAAIANARLAYQHYLSLMGSEPWRRLADRGALPQRLLWASTGAKNPAYRDVMYVEELVGPFTVNTLPPATLEAFLNHGVAQSRITSHVNEARHTLESLQAQGISLDAVTDQLLAEGVKLFADSFDKLLSAVQAKSAALG